jgi:hypothetical protein
MFKNLPALPTFKSLPQAIGLPFLSTQEDAQLKFKSGESGIKRLYSEQVRRAQVLCACGVHWGTMGEGD